MTQSNESSSQDSPQISLTGTSQPDSCLPGLAHVYILVGSRDINPKTDKAYGKNTPGKCKACGKEKMFDSGGPQPSSYSQFRLS